LKNAFSNMAKMNYPYETNLPAWPVNVACNSFAKATEPDQTYYEEFKAASEIYLGK